MLRQRVVSGQWLVVSGEGPRRPAALLRRRSGITLTEILIAIMILGIGLVSLATLFPIGLLRLRDANRWTRSAILLQTAASDAVSRGLFSSQSFAQADNYNIYINSNNPPYWYATATSHYNPLIQDTPFYGGDWLTGAYTGSGGLGSAPYTQLAFNGYVPTSGAGLPFAYDPLWRNFVTSTGGLLPGTPGYYIGDTFEARFGYGLTTVRPDPSGGGPPSAHGLQRITNFNRAFYGQVPIMPASQFVPNIFVSQEDVLWQTPDSNANAYTMEGVSLSNGGVPLNGPSPIIPDLNTSGGSVTLDWRYSWMFTGQLTSANNASCFDGNIVIWENRPFGIQVPDSMPFTPQGNYAAQTYQVAGETVVEAIFGYSAAVQNFPGSPYGYGSAAARTVLLRWPASMPDPVVRPGDWIADVTYERSQAVVNSRWWMGGTNANGQPVPTGVPNLTNNLEWDNLPAQRCYWYQVQKAGTPAPATGNMNFGDPVPHRYMVVFVNQDLLSRTPLNTGGSPYYLNAALIAPNVINVIPQTIFIR